MHVWTWGDEEKGLSPRYAALFQRLPAVQSIFGHRLGSGPVASEDTRSVLPLLERASSPLKHLELRDSRLLMENLTHLLQAPKGLTTFIYEIGRSNLTTGGISFNGIVKALEPQKHSLENLWLNHEHTLYRGSHRAMYSHVDFDNAHADDLTSISSFAGFQTLKLLRVASIFLLGLRDGVEGGWNDRVRSFPSTLEILHISHCEKH